MDNTKKAGAVGLITGFILGILFAPLFSSTTRVGNNTYNMMGSENVLNQNIDRHFIEEMIPHHDGAIVMAELALTNAKRPEIIALAKNIIEAQKKENDQMQSWYKDWFGNMPSNSSEMGGMMGHGNMGMQMMGMDGDLLALKSAKDFDLEFIKQMIPHHEMAIMMARMLLASTNRPEMKKLAGDIITSQSEEIKMMQGWYSKWSK